MACASGNHCSRGECNEAFVLLSCIFYARVDPRKSFSPFVCPPVLFVVDSLHRPHPVRRQFKIPSKSEEPCDGYDFGVRFPPDFREESTSYEGELRRKSHPPWWVLGWREYHSTGKIHPLEQFNEPMKSRWSRLVQLRKGIRSSISQNDYLR